MATKSAHLVERATERLLHAGLLEGSSAQLLEADHRLASPPAASIAPADSATDADVAAPDHSARVPRIIEMAALWCAGMLDWSRARSRISEEIRLAQRQLLRMAFAPEAESGVTNLVMVTSAKPGEGKSFIALNLACSIATQGDHDVLLIDCDAKPRSLSQALGLADAPGVLDLAANPALVPDEVVIRTEVEQLYFLPVGWQRGHSSELFAKREMAQLIRRLGRHANRLVILDAAPCLSTSDSAALAAVAGQTLMVVEAEKTQRAEVEAALELLQPCPSVMLVLNKVQASHRHAFGAYSEHSSS